MPGSFFDNIEPEVFIKNIYYIGDYFSTDPNYHNWYHPLDPPREYHSFYYIVDGEAVLCPGEKRIHVRPNDIVYVPAGYPYYSYGKKAPFVWIMFSFIGDVKEGLFNDTTYDDSNYFKKIFEEINTKWMTKPFGYQLKITSLMYGLLNDLLLKTHQQYYSPLKRELMNKADEYIQANLTSPSFSVNDLINYTGTGDTYFRETFKEIHNTSPVKYINRLRIEKAKEYLINTDISINRIAVSVGFINIYYFSNVFKQIVGESPSQYRKRHLGSNHIN